MPLTLPVRAVRLRPAALFLLAIACASPARAANHPGPPITIPRAAGAIAIDGDLSDAGWQGLTEVTTWYETRVGDNVEPQVKNVAWLAYDDKYLYAAFRFDDPNPGSVRAPLGDHDQLSGATDYGGLIIDSRDDGKTAQMFLANPRGLQYDAISSDVSGEDSSPDFFWDAAGKITSTGWNLEIRVPFSSLRYGNDASPTWGLLLYRNYPRDRHYQFFSARLPRDVNCFICNSSPLSGLAELPRGSHLVVAPFATSQHQSLPPADAFGDPVLGQPLVSGDVKFDAGADVKWNPGANTAIDATINPDFSQIESDAPQIAANERFALFFSEKRPFFLEGVDLLSTPFQAVYTRTITDPSGGLRATGRSGGTAFTGIVAHDKGGGVVILPGPQGSGAAPQDFPSDVGIFRIRHDLGKSFVSLLGTTRELDDGRYNRVGGPDFQWRPNDVDKITGQALYSESRTPTRPDLAADAPEWDGRKLTDHAAVLNWGHNTQHVDWFIQGQELGEDFRADDGFIPQVGYRELYVEPGYTIRPKKSFFSRVRLFSVNYVDYSMHDDLLNRRLSVGAGMDGRWGSFLRIELNHDRILVGTDELERFRPRVYLEASPGRFLNYFSIDVNSGQEIDFSNGREGTGTSLGSSLVLRPSSHLETSLTANRRWLNVDSPLGIGNVRLFLADADRVRATWSFSSRSFVRLIAQYVKTTRDPSAYLFPVPGRSSEFNTSALFAYKLNWQTVLYAGYGDAREYLVPSDRLEKAGQQAFAKISYAWQL